MNENKLRIVILIEFILLIFLSNLALANPFENIQLTDGFVVIGRELNNILTKNLALLAIVLVSLALLFYAIINTSLKKTPMGENKTVSWSLAILMVSGLYYKSIPYGGMTAFLDNVLGQTVALILVIFTVIVFSWLKGNKSMGTPLILAVLLVITWYYNQDQAQYLIIGILILLFVLIRRFNVFSQDNSKGSIYNDKPSTFKEKRKWIDRTKRTGKEIYDTLKKDLQTAEEKERFIKDTYQKEKVHETINKFLEDTTNKLENEFREVSIFLEHKEIPNAKNKLQDIKKEIDETITKSANLPNELKNIKNEYKKWQTFDLDKQIRRLRNLNIDNEKNKHLVEDLGKINKLSKQAEKIKKQLLDLEIQDDHSYKRVNERLEDIKHETINLLRILDSNEENKTEDFKHHFKEALDHIERLKKPEQLIENNPLYEEKLLTQLYKININIKEILSKAEKEEIEEETQIEKDLKNNHF